MASYASIEAEINRFLRTDEPEVLCIRGSWGVGKTYTWKRLIRTAETDKELALEHPSYVSLFGLTTLDEVRHSIAANEELGEADDGDGYGDRLKKAFTQVWHHAKKFRGGSVAAASLFGARDLADFVYQSAFALVRKKVICFDDLERAGVGLHVRDILGLASFLKEERECKVVLLLNDKEIGKGGSKDFRSHIEKVADINIEFDLTAEEAVEVVFPGPPEQIEFLAPNLIALGINNIRIIKKIERLAARLTAVLEPFDEAVREQAMATLVLGGWSVNQRDIAPSIDFIEKYNRNERQLRNDEEKDPKEADWEKALESYPYLYTDDMDSVILKYVRVGFFDEAEIRSKAAKLQEGLRLHNRENALSKVWSDLYHGSLATDDNEFLDRLGESALVEVKYTSPVNMNSAVRMLRDHGRAKQADNLIARYFEAHSDKDPKFFDIEYHFFGPEDRIDDRFRAAFEERRSAYVDDRDPRVVLESIGERRSWNKADAALFGRLSEEELMAVVEALRGEFVRPAIESLLAIGRSNYPESPELLKTATSALRRIAAKSPIRAEKVRRFGIGLENGD